MLVVQSLLRIFTISMMTCATLFLVLLIAEQALAGNSGRHKYYNYGEHPLPSADTSESLIITTTTSSVPFAGPTFAIRNAGQTQKLAVYEDTGPYRGEVCFVPVARLGEDSTFSLSKEGWLQLESPSPSALFGRNGSTFQFIYPGLVGQPYSICHCSLDAATSQLSCNCDGATMFCVSPVGDPYPCDGADPVPGTEVMAWYAFPIDPNDPIPTSSTTSATNIQTAQPTFAIQDADQERELSVVYQNGRLDAGRNLSFDSVSSRDGPIPKFTLNDAGNLIYVTPDDPSTAFVAYGGTRNHFVFEDPDGIFASYDLLDRCVCSIDSASSQLTCNCGGILVNCVDSCDAWFAVPVFASASPPFTIRDATQEHELSLVALFSNYALPELLPISSRECPEPQFMLAENGTLFHITPGSPTTGLLAFGVDFGYLEFLGPDSIDNKFVLEDPCTCSINSVSSQLTCHCQGALLTCVQGYCQYGSLYAFPVDPVASTTVSSPADTPSTFLSSEQAGR